MHRLPNQQLIFPRHDAVYCVTDVPGLFVTDVLGSDLPHSERGPEARSFRKDRTGKKHSPFPNGKETRLPWPRPFPEVFEWIKADKRAYADRVSLKASLFFPVFFLSGCTSPESTVLMKKTPLTAAAAGPAFAGYSLEVADTDGNKCITRSEWLTAGGTEQSFNAIDKDRDNVLTHDELSSASSPDRLFSFAKKMIDNEGSTEMTPRNFRSPAGARLFSFEF